MSTQLMLIDLPVVGVYPMAMRQANQLLVDWNHKLGPVNRPMCRSEGWVLSVQGDPVAVAVSAPIVSPTVQGFDRTEVIELARLCARPGVTWANRILLRVWREVLAQKYECWRPIAAVSYSVNALHTGNLYRHDGWTLVTDKAGETRDRNWIQRSARSGQRDENDPKNSKKTLWLWDYRRQDAS